MSRAVEFACDSSTIGIVPGNELCESRSGRRWIVARVEIAALSLVPSTWWRRLWWRLRRWLS